MTFGYPYSYGYGAPYPAYPVAGYGRGGIWIAILIVLFILLIIFGGWWWYATFY